MISNKFTNTLGEMRKGQVLNDLADALTEVIEGVRETNKDGSVTLKIDIKPVKGDGNQVLISDDIKRKVPRPSAPATFFYTDEGGVLTRNDPRQRDWVAEQESDKPTTEDAPEVVNG